MLEDIVRQVREGIHELTGDLFFYRGHSDSNWPLLPALARHKTGIALESILYYDFVTRAGALLPPNSSSWAHVFAMQHHGLPTRLLDWTTTFGVALYFATKASYGDAAVWMLKPFELNKSCWGSETLPSPEELEVDYYGAFIAEEKKIAGPAVAISPSRENPRIFNQKAAFTLHIDLTTPLDKLCQKAVRKIIIPHSAMDEALEFLNLAGISEYSLFPDLDGLARDLLMEHFG
jgi:hypothetical protein